MVVLSTLLLSILASQVTAHTFIWGVFVNGVDQGSWKAIRIPAYNAAPDKGGYNNSPVKDLNSIDLRCNVLGDIPAHETIKVAPGDNLTFDWHHNYRNDTDDVIDTSHHGPSLVYISPNPPTNNSFVKLWHEGKFVNNPYPQAGKWSTTGNIRPSFGHQNVRIPADLAPGQYLIRAELIALHEGDVSYLANPKRGAQFYPDCVQIEVTGTGTTTLPADGVSFPGAYKYSDPGIVHNVYCSTQTVTLKTPSPCPTNYVIPGPTVWSGAWPTTTAVSVGPRTGVTTHVPWSTWVGPSSVVTSVSYSDVKSQTTVGTSTYAASWSEVYATPTGTAPRW